MPYPSHSHVVVLFVSVPWLLERKRSIISTQVASKSNQHLKKKKKGERTGQENPKREPKTAAGKIFIQAKFNSQHNNLIQTHHPNNGFCTEFTCIHIALVQKEHQKGSKLWLPTAMTTAGLQPCVWGLAD